MFACRSRSVLLAALVALSLAPVFAADPEASLVSQIETQFRTIEHLLGTLRHVAATTVEGSAPRTQLTCEAWFVPGDAVETPVKVTLLEASGPEHREMAFWLDQGRLFLVKERVTVAGESSSEVTERRRLYDGAKLFRLEARSAKFPLGQPTDLSTLPFVPAELPIEAETEGMMLEEIALETASQLAPVALTNRPVRWE